MNFWAIVDHNWPGAEYAELMNRCRGLIIEYTLFYGVAA